MSTDENTVREPDDGSGRRAFTAAPNAQQAADSFIHQQAGRSVGVAA
jgi:hypothetical protein